MQRLTLDVQFVNIYTFKTCRAERALWQLFLRPIMFWPAEEFRFRKGDLFV